MKETQSALIKGVLYLRDVCIFQKQLMGTGQGKRPSLGWKHIWKESQATFIILRVLTIVDNNGILLGNSPVLHCNHRYVLFSDMSVNHNMCLLVTGLRVYVRIRILVDSCGRLSLGRTGHSYFRVACLISMPRLNGQEI